MEKEKSVQKKLENAKKQQDKLFGAQTGDASIVKLHEELKRITEQGREKQKKLEKEIEEMEKVIFFLILFSF